MTPDHFAIWTFFAGLIVGYILGLVVAISQFKSGRWRYSKFDGDDE